jgi:hypothetical protein
MSHSREELSLCRNVLGMRSGDAHETSHARVRPASNSARAVLGTRTFGAVKPRVSLRSRCSGSRTRDARAYEPQKTQDQKDE